LCNIKRYIQNIQEVPGALAGRYGYGYGYRYGYATK